LITSVTAALLHQPLHVSFSPIYLMYRGRGLWLSCTFAAVCRHDMYRAWGSHVQSCSCLV